MLKASQSFLLLIILPSLIFGLTIGTISDRPSKKLKWYKPFAKYIEKKLKEYGIEEKVNVRFAKDINHMKKLIENGKIQIFIDSVYPSLKVCLEGICEPALIRWKNKVRSYHSLIIVRKDSSIKNTNDLVGRKIAFDEPWSTSGYFVPVVYLLERGFKLIELKSISEEVPDGCIGYIFASEEENVIGWVFYKKVDAGALYDIKFRKIAKDKAHYFRIIWKSPPIPRHLVNFSISLDTRLKEAVIKILLNMHKDKEGRKVLKKFKKTLKFEILSERDRELLEKFKNAIIKYGL